MLTRIGRNFKNFAAKKIDLKGAAKLCANFANHDNQQKPSHDAENLLVEKQSVSFQGQLKGFIDLGRYKYPTGIFLLFTP